MKYLSSPKIGYFGEGLALRANWAESLWLFYSLVIALLYPGRRFILGRIADGNCVGDPGKEVLKVSLALLRLVSAFLGAW
jgi:hypothetical protein